MMDGEFDKSVAATISDVVSRWCGRRACVWFALGGLRTTVAAIGYTARVDIAAA